MSIHSIFRTSFGKVGHTDNSVLTSCTVCVCVCVCVYLSGQVCKSQIKLSVTFVIVEDCLNCVFKCLASYLNINCYEDPLCRRTGGEGGGGVGDKGRGEGEQIVKVRVERGCRQWKCLDMMLI
jgi:hypothetical protein